MDVDLVRVACVVRDGDGRFVSNLTKEDFEVLDNGVPQPIKYLTRATDTPLTIGLLVDRSLSQRQFIERHQTRARAFLRNVMRPKDQGFVAAFKARTWLLQDLTPQVNLLQEAVDRLLDPLQGLRELTPARRAREGTAYYDSLYFSARERLKEAEGRKVLIVLTDGQDNQSRRDRSDTIEMAQSADVLVYHLPAIRGISIGLISPATSALRNRAGMKAMERISEETGGRVLEFKKQSAEEAFAELENELRSMYEVSFALPAGAQVGEFRKLQVKVANRKLKVRHRTGYRVTAPAPSPGAPTR
jgi:Ca-activated chloride channel family protein